MPSEKRTYLEKLSLVRTKKIKILKDDTAEPGWGRGLNQQQRYTGQERGGKGMGGERGGEGRGEEREPTNAYHNHSFVCWLKQKYNV